MKSRLAARRADPTLRQRARGTLSAAELAKIVPAVEVDALGTFCPEPVIRTQNRMATMEPRGVLLLYADDAGVEVDIPAWCIGTGNEFLGIVKEPNVYRVFVRKL